MKHHSAFRPIILGLTAGALVVALAVCAVLFAVNARLQSRLEQAEDQNAQLSEAIDEKEAQLRSLQDKCGELEAECGELRDQIEALENSAAQAAAAPEEPEETFSMENYAPGDLLTDPLPADERLMFCAYEIPRDGEVFERINGRSYRDNPNIGLEDLRYLKVVHYNFDHELQVGELIVNRAVSEDVLNVFRELYEAEYEIESMRLIDDFWAGDGHSSDGVSIDHNNTSAFCYRTITNGSGLSNHAFGCAIDLNPQQNPYVYYTDSGWTCSHSNAFPYLDRGSGDPHVITEGDVCYSIFAKYGFSWGGLWSDPIDYQHFEKEIN